jgi:hypothetical protein
MKDDVAISVEVYVDAMRRLPRPSAEGLAMTPQTLA